MPFVQIAIRKARGVPDSKRMKEEVRVMNNAGIAMKR
jgi:hypothetical protein